MSADATMTRGYTATKDQLLARLRRVEGQVREQVMGAGRFITPGETSRL